MIFPIIKTIIDDRLLSTDNFQEIKCKMNNAIIYDYYQDKNHNALLKVTGFFDLWVKNWIRNMHTAGAPLELVTHFFFLCLICISMSLCSVCILINKMVFFWKPF